jgi:hypothetical protein
MSWWLLTLVTLGILFAAFCIGMVVTAIVIVLRDDLRKQRKASYLKWLEDEWIDPKL